MKSATKRWEPQSQLITPAELPELFAEHRIVIIHCGAVWNGVDLPFDARIQALKPEFTDDMGFYALDIDEEINRQFCVQHDLLNIPTLVCYIDGVWVDTVIGALLEEGLRTLLQHWLTTAKSGNIIPKQLMTWQLSVSRPFAYASSRTWRSYSVRQSVTLRASDKGEANLSFSVTQDWENVRRNRDAACRVLLFTPEQLIMPAQTHGANVAVVDADDAGKGALSPDTAIPDCDALVTNTPGLLLGITIADCLPVFFLDPVHKAIGLAHSGWRGTAGHIAVRTLEVMGRHFGTQPNDCLISIGPGIGSDGYEVDKTVYNGFMLEDRQAVGVFTPTRPGHWQLDLYAAVCHQLQQANICAANFDICQYRTNRHTNLFFSHRLVPGCGRMGAFIGLSVER